MQSFLCLVNYNQMALGFHPREVKPKKKEFLLAIIIESECEFKRIIHLTGLWIQ